jgi:hypothetical protein
MVIMDKDMLAFWIAFSLMITTLIGCVTYYNYNQTQAVKSNIETALGKGIDPLSVRCAYSNSQDTVCVAYAARK